MRILQLVWSSDVSTPNCSKDDCQTLMMAFGQRNGNNWTQGRVATIWMALGTLCFGELQQVEARRPFLIPRADVSNDEDYVVCNIMICFVA